MSDRVLAWGVVCGSGERAGKLHLWIADGFEVAEVEEYEDRAVDSVDFYDQRSVNACGPHRVVALVERPEEGR